MKLNVGKVVGVSAEDIKTLIIEQLAREGLKPKGDFKINIEDHWVGDDRFGTERRITEIGNTIIECEKLQP